MFGGVFALDRRLRCLSQQELMSGGSKRGSEATRNQLTERSGQELGR